MLKREPLLPKPAEPPVPPKAVQLALWNWACSRRYLGKFQSRGGSDDKTVRQEESAAFCRFLAALNEWEVPQ